MVRSSRSSRSRAGGHAADAAARVPAAGEELGPRRRAHRLHEEAVEPCAVLGQRVDVRRAEVGVAVEAQVAPALIVGEDDDDVRLRLLGTQCTDRRKKDGDDEQDGSAHGNLPFSSLNDSVGHRATDMILRSSGFAPGP